jgi:hypothetical protein
MLAKGQEQSEFETVWPLVMEKDFCGDWEQDD